MLPDFQKNITLFKIPRFHPFIFLVSYKQLFDERTHETLVKWFLQGKTEALGESVPVLLCPPRNSHELAWHWSRASMVRVRQATASNMTQPILEKN